MNKKQEHKSTVEDLAPKDLVRVQENERGWIDPRV